MVTLTHELGILAVVANSLISPASTSGSERKAAVAPLCTITCMLIVTSRLPSRTVIVELVVEVVDD